MSKDLTLLLRVSGPFFESNMHATFSSVNDEISVSAPKSRWMRPTLHYCVDDCCIVREENNAVAYKGKQKIAVFQMGMRLRKHFNEYFLRRIE